MTVGTEGVAPVALVTGATSGIGRAAGSGLAVTGSRLWCTVGTLSEAPR